MATLRKSIAVITLFLLILLIGSILLGVRFGKRFLEKKLLTAANARILKDLSGELAWKKISLDPFQSTITIEDVSFSGSEDKNFPFESLSAKRVQVRYSLVKLLGMGRLFFPRVRFEGLKGKWTASGAALPPGSTPYIPAPPSEEIVQRSLSKARRFLKKVDVLDGDWEIEFPASGRKMHLQEVEVHSDLSSKNFLSVTVSIPKIRVIGPIKDNRFMDEWFSLHEAAFCLAKDSLHVDSFSLSSGSGGEEVRLHGDISHLFREFPALALSYQARIGWDRLKPWYSHLPFHGSIQGSPLTARGEIGGTMDNPMVKGTAEVEKVEFLSRGKELSGDTNQPCFTVSSVKSQYLYKNHKIILSQASFSAAMPGTGSSPAPKPAKFAGQAEFSFPDKEFSFAASADGLDLPLLNRTFNQVFVHASDEKSFLHKLQHKIQEEYPIGGCTVSFQGKLLQEKPLQGQLPPGFPPQGKPLRNCRLPLAGSGEFDVRLTSPSKKDPLLWKGKISFPEKGDILVDSSDLRLAGNSLRFHGGLNFSGDEKDFRDEKGKGITFDAKLANIAGLSVLWPAIKRSGAGGKIFFAGTLDGPFSDPRVSGSLTWQDAAFQRFSAQKIEGVVRYEQKFIFLSRLRLQQNQTSVTVDGKISALTGQGDLHAEADPIYYDDLEQILKLQAMVLIKGRMTCQSDFQILPASQQKFYGRGRVSTGECSIADKRHPALKQHFDSVTSAFEVDGDKFQLDDTIGTLGRQKVRAELIFPYHHEVPDRFWFSSEDWDLSYLDIIQENKIHLGGKSSFQIRGKGGIGSGDWEWKVTVHHPQYEGFSLDQVAASVQMQGKEYQGEVMAGENKFSVQGNMDGGVSYQLVGQIPRLKVEPNLSYLSGMLKKNMPSAELSKGKIPDEQVSCQQMPYQDPKSSPPVTIRDKILREKVIVELAGQVKARGYLNNFQQSSGEFIASEATIFTPLHTFSASRPFTVAYDQGRFFTSDSCFTGEGVEARLSGNAGQDRQVDFSFSGNAPMAYLWQKYALLTDSPASQTPAGNVQFDLSLKGSPGSLRFSSRIKAAHCSFDLPRLNRRVEDVQGDILIDEKAITITSLTGTCHEGTFSLSGRLNMQDFTIASVDLNLKGKNVLLTSAARYKFILDGDLHLQGSKKHSDLTGSVDVREGRYHRDVGILQSLLTRQRKIDVDEKSLGDFPLSNIDWLNNTSFNVRISIPQDVWVKSSFFTAEIARSVFFMKGNLSHPYLEGQVRTINGAIMLGGNRFQIVSGLLDMTDPEREDTSLDIVACADVDTYRITANIFGAVDDPQIRLSSTPCLSQTDIMNMIALGISSDGGAGGESAGQMNMGSPLVSDIFGNQVTSFSGIDLFRAKVLNRDLLRVDLFKFKVGEESGAVEKITVGRDITKRLQLKYSIPAGVEKREVAEADYKLSDYIKLIGSQDDLGTYSLDLNFSFEF